jgi:CRISPR/Cas system-associated exonuclease Cas4 (RecB family)
MRELIAGLKIKPRSQAEEIAETLEAAYIMMRRNPTSNPKLSFAPSGLGAYQGVCPRYWWLLFDGAERIDVTDALGFANMRVGVDAHTRLEDLFKAADLLIDRELEIKMEDPPIMGYADVLINWKGEEIVGEIKTTRQEVFMHRAMQRKPASEHLLQVLIYMHVLKKQKGFILYENKNTQQILVIPVIMNDHNKEELEKAFMWMREVRSAWEAGTPPKPVFQQRNKICQSCPVNKVCWSDAKPGTISIPKMGVITV